MHQLQLACRATLIVRARSVTSITCAGMLLALPFAAGLSDQYGRKPVALIGIGCSTLLCAMLGFAQSYWTLVIIRFLMGVLGSAQAA